MFLLFLIQSASPTASTSSTSHPPVLSQHPQDSSTATAAAATAHQQLLGPPLQGALLGGCRHQLGGQRHQALLLLAGAAGLQGLNGLQQHRNVQLPVVRLGCSTGSCPAGAAAVGRIKGTRSVPAQGSGGRI
jgi:hypothetical protein